MASVRHLAAENHLDTSVLHGDETRIGNPKAFFACPPGRTPPPAATPCRRRWRRPQRATTARRSGLQQGVARRSATCAEAGACDAYRAEPNFILIPLRLPPLALSVAFRYRSRHRRSSGSPPSRSAGGRHPATYLPPSGWRDHSARVASPQGAEC